MARTQRILTWFVVPWLAGCATDDRLVSLAESSDGGSGGAAGAFEMSSGAPEGSTSNGASATGESLPASGPAGLPPSNGADSGAACDAGVCSPTTNGPPTLSFSFSGAASGRAVLRVDGVEVLACSGPCELEVSPGTWVTLTAQPPSGGTVRRWSETSCGNEVSCRVRVDQSRAVQVELELGFNVAFVTSELYTTQALPRPGAASNQRCAELAAAAGVRGERWVAWLAAGGGSPGPEDDIEPIETFQHTGGWVRTDGVIVARSLAALRRTEILHGISRDELGRAVGNVQAWTAVAPGGVLGRDASDNALDCQNWTSVATDQFGATSFATGIGIQFAGSSAGRCNQRYAMYCFGDDSDAEVPVVIPTPSRLAFLTEDYFDSSLGIAGADALCQREACDAGLTGGVNCAVDQGTERIFKAYLHSTAQPGWERFNLEGPSWARRDGVMWLHAADLANDGRGRLTGLNVTLSSGHSLLRGGTWVGDRTLNGTCQDWTTSEGEGLLHLYNIDDGDPLTGTNLASCGSAKLYCLEE